MSGREKEKLIIWDFNGTILDDMQLCRACVNELLRKYGLRELATDEEYHRVFRFPIEDYYAAAGFDFSKVPYRVLADEWVAKYEAGAPYLRAVSGVRETLEKLRTLGCRQIVLSSSERNMLLRDLARLGLTEYFDTVLGLDNVYAGGKTQMALEWAGGPLRNAVLIGDTTHDFDTARALQARCVLFTGGHNSRAALEACGVPVVDSLCEIPGELEKMNFLDNASNRGN